MNCNRQQIYAAMCQKSTGKVTLHAWMSEKESNESSSGHEIFSSAVAKNQLHGECVFYWRYDGAYYGIKASQQLAHKSNIDITKRFRLACTYCLEQSIQTLWSEMEASVKTEILESSHCCMERFWVRRMIDGSRVPWRDI
ncbi:hypothetical protein AVEN_107928-1 [Araneus ventricosus]|uniref:Uncharacterized protein n=1 Tax=Araneus ventricosus TaxID=182803 RepID=A0A4Y2KZU3_ARAVE|nr:hypothetical protein AVEN_107928-1 [Araneus ventricosus]